MGIESVSINKLIDGNSRAFIEVLAMILIIKVLIFVMQVTVRIGTGNVSTDGVVAELEDVVRNAFKAVDAIIVIGHTHHFYKRLHSMGDKIRDVGSPHYFQGENLEFP